MLKSTRVRTISSPSASPRHRTCGPLMGSADGTRLLGRHVAEEPYKSTADVHGWMGLCSFNIARKGPHSGCCSGGNILLSDLRILCREGCAG